jgi:hypothetical protein
MFVTAQLRLFILILMGPLLLWAEDDKPNKFELLPKDVYFQPGGGVRLRYDNLRGATGGAFSDESEALITHRAQINFKLYKGEFFETEFRLINFANWGASSPNNSVPGQRDAFERSNSLLVNQAFAHWKITESMGMRFGRAPLHLGLGYTYGTNEWFDVPYSFDLIEASWDWPVLKASLIAAKVLDLTQVAGETLNPDPDENHFIFNFDLKNLHEAVTIANFSLIQVNRDPGSLDGGASLLNGLNMQRVALDTEIKGRNLFFQGFFTFVSGEERILSINQVSGIDKKQINQMAYDLKLGYHLPGSNNLRFWAGYHFDSGDDNPQGGVSKSFDSFYYEVYGQAGLMDLLRWGNLNFVRLGLDVDLFDGFTLGGELLSFNKTEGADGLRFGQAGRFLNQKIESGDLILAESSLIGRELDIWADWKFPSGVKVRGTMSAFFPGDVFTEATGNFSGMPNGTIFQFLTQVGYFF